MADFTHQRIILTSEGKHKAEEELNYLKHTKRKQITEKIRTAKELGDLSENAEYSAAKDEQAFTESRIRELDHLLKYAEVVSGKNAGLDVIVVGSKVTITDETGVEKVYTIVGFNEASPSEGKISNESPLGRSLVGHRVGETVVFEVPSGERQLKIISVK